MSEQIQKLQNDVIILKSRAFDLGEVIQQKEEEVLLYRNLLGHICSVLEIDGSQGVQPEAVIAAIQSLKENFKKAADDEEFDEEEPGVGMA